MAAGSGVGPGLAIGLFPRDIKTTITGSIHKITAGKVILKISFKAQRTNDIFINMKIVNLKVNWLFIIMIDKMEI